MVFGFGFGFGFGWLKAIRWVVFLVFGLWFWVWFWFWLVEGYKVGGLFGLWFWFGFGLVGFGEKTCKQMICFVDFCCFQVCVVLEDTINHPFLTTPPSARCESPSAAEYSRSPAWRLCPPWLPRKEVVDRSTSKNTQ